MDKDKLSAREAALITAARREAQARKGAAVPPQAAVAPQPALQVRAAPAARPAPPVAERPKPSAAERLAMLMAEERAETERRKKKMRRYGIIIPSVVIALTALWALFVTRRR